MSEQQSGKLIYYNQNVCTHSDGSQFKYSDAALLSNNSAKSLICFRFPGAGDAGQCYDASYKNVALANTHCTVDSTYSGKLIDADCTHTVQQTPGGNPPTLNIYTCYPKSK